MGNKLFQQGATTMVIIMSLFFISQFDESSLFSGNSMTWNTMLQGLGDATINATFGQFLNGTEMASLSSSQFTNGSLEEKQLIRKHGNDTNHSMISAAFSVVLPKDASVVSKNATSEREEKSNETIQNVGVISATVESEDSISSNSTLREVGNGTIMHIVYDRNELPKCFASSLEEAQVKCFVNGTTAFLCDIEQSCPEDNLQCESTCTPELATLAVRDLFVLHERGVAFNPFDGILYDISGGCCGRYRWKQGDVLTIPSSVLSGNQSAPIVLLKHNHDQTYYHFSIEVMARLARTAKSVRTAVALGELDINVPHTMSFHQPFLDMVLCPPDRPSCASYRTEMGPLHSVLLFPPEYNENFIVQLQIQYKSRFKPTTKCCPSKPKFIVLKREKTRLVKNFLPFISMLEESYPDIDFPIITERELERMNFSDYADLFGHAHGLIGEHGAGLSNLVWLDSPEEAARKYNPNITVVQIIRQGQGGNYFGGLSRILGYNYVEIPGVLVPGERPSNNYAHTEITDLCAAQEQLHPSLILLSRHQKNTTLCP